MNQINVIRPYLSGSSWVFDDPSRGLRGEALVAGMPEIIGAACAAFGVVNPDKGFTVVFSKDAFPDEQFALDWVAGDRTGNTYQLKLEGMETPLLGWLCPALFKYFEEAPKQIHVQVKN